MSEEAVVPIAVVTTEQAEAQAPADDCVSVAIVHWPQVSDVISRPRLVTHLRRALKTEQQPNSEVLFFLDKQETIRAVEPSTGKPNDCYEESVRFISETLFHGTPKEQWPVMHVNGILLEHPIDLFHRLTDAWTATNPDNLSADVLRDVLVSSVALLKSEVGGIVAEAAGINVSEAAPPMYHITALKGRVECTMLRTTANNEWVLLYWDTNIPAPRYLIATLAVNLTSSAARLASSALPVAVVSSGAAVASLVANGVFNSCRTLHLVRDGLPQEVVYCEVRCRAIPSEPSSDDFVVICHEDGQ